MCGRYTFKLTWAEIVNLYRLTLPDEEPPGLKPSFNVAPTQVMPIRTAPTYREPFAKRRCLVPATGWYEWQDVGEKKKRPMHMRPKDIPFALAGV
jgi:putative SOS response-associated peptidase YedK